MFMQWRIQLLGGLRAHRDERSIARFRTHKTAALLAYLAYYRERDHPREVLVELLWPDLAVPQGRSSLSTALSSLRRQLEPPDVPAGSVIRADRSSVQLDAAVVSTDVAAFRGGLASAAGAVEEREQLLALADAVDLYRGELLPGFYDDWCLAERERLAGEFSRALHLLVTKLTANGHLDHALGYARRAVAADPFREQVQRELIHLLVAAGQEAAAVRQYRQFERALRRHFGEGPSAELRQYVDGLGAPQRPLTPAGANVGRGRRCVAGPSDPSADPSRGTCVSPPLAQKPDTPALTGTVTFLVAETETTGSGPTPGCALTLLRPLMRGHGGSEVHLPGAETSTRGEGAAGMQVAFGRASDAFAAAVEARRALTADLQRWADPSPTEGMPLPLRMVLDTGEVEPGNEVYSSPALPQALRLLHAAAAGQLLLTERSAALVRDDLPGNLRLIDLGLYRLSSVAPAQRLFRLDDREVRFDQSPPRLPPVQLGNLPPPYSRFFGRANEMAHVAGLLACARTRLVTLTGPGGSGKTRLAIEVARSVVDLGKAAVWFVSLAETAEAERILEVLHGALGIVSSRDSVSLDEVTALLSQQPTLLILDNLEHLAEHGAPIIRTLLDRIPVLTCLITSRQKLGIEGEQEVAVRPLPTPALSATPEELVRCESVQLFVDRAQAVRPDFQVTRQNAAAVAALCGRLEGLPLALELAAARVHILTPAQMTSQLRRGFDFLVNQRRDVAPRHRSLRASTEWSYRLLSPASRQLFPCLAIFSGGWTLEAAEAVCACGSPGSRDESGSDAVLDAVAELLLSSLITVVSGEAAIRFAMLEAVREYAGQQLMGDSYMTARRRHAEYYVRVAEAAACALPGETQRAWQERLEADQANLRAVLEWSLSPAGDPRLGRRLARALSSVWALRGREHEGRAAPAPAERAGSSRPGRALPAPRPERSS